MSNSDKSKEVGIALLALMVVGVFLLLVTEAPEVMEVVGAIVLFGIAALAVIIFSMMLWEGIGESIGVLIFIIGLIAMLWVVLS